MTNINSLVYADGNSIAVVWCEGKNEMVYQFSSVIVNKVTVDLESNFDDINLIGNSHKIMCLSPSVVTAYIELKVSSENVKQITSNQGNILNSLRSEMLKEFSVSQLFRAINQKLEEREG